MTHTGDQQRADAPANAPSVSRWLLVPLVLLAAAMFGGLFALWGINGPKYLFDMIAAYCF
jgi:hypothetical protein